MNKNIPAIPKGYHSLTPYLCVAGAARAIEFYKKAFGAQELMRMEHGDKVGHAEIQIGDSRVMIADEFPDIGFLGPGSFGGSPVYLHLYVQDVDSRFEQAIAAGAKVRKPLKDQFYGDRSGCLEDPFGHFWFVSSHIEDVSPGEIHRRMTAEYAT